MAYIYFSYKDSEIQTPVNILASIVQQLVRQRPKHCDAVKNLHTRCIRENSRPSVGDVTATLEDVLLSFPKVYLVIDALDECTEENEVRSILLTELKKFQHHVSLIVMSRPIPDIEDLLSGAVILSIEASPVDIRNYLEQRLASTRSVQKHFKEEPSLQTMIVSRIMEMMKGM